MRHSNEERWSTCAPAHAIAGSVQYERRAPRVIRARTRAVCTMAHGPHLALLDVTGPALGRYAERHGYELIEIRHRLDPSRPPSWDKIVLLRELVRRFDIVVWFDADALILDAAPDIEDALRPR